MPLAVIFVYFFCFLFLLKASGEGMIDESGITLNFENAEGYFGCKSNTLFCYLLR